MTLNTRPPPRRCFTKINPATGEKKVLDLSTFLADLRKEDEQSTARGDRFSRGCRQCGETEPLLRSVWVPCGHTVCRDCASTSADCPVCSNRPNRVFTCTGTVPLYEDENRSRQCGVCLNEAPFRRVLLSGCGHVFCRACAMQLQTTCPFCRQPLRGGKKVALQEEVIRL